MNDLQIKIIDDPNIADRSSFENFANANWGEHSFAESDEDRYSNFFDQPKFIVYGYLNKVIVGGLLIYIRDIVFEDKKIKMAGIGGVVTDINYRHQGIMTTILEYSFEKLLPKYKVDIALLGTEIHKLGALYAKVGFVPLPQKYYFIDKNMGEKVGEGAMIAPVGNKKLVKDIIESGEKLMVGNSNF